ncbi:hypothetical protein HOB95_03470, partial [bacterium]|nr:hypothetical protein [bacterium]
MKQAHCLSMALLCTALFNIQAQQQNPVILTQNAQDQVDLQAVLSSKQPAQEQKIANWTVMIYISADNDLFSFAGRNMKQMEAIGSNENLNIIV